MFDDLIDESFYGIDDISEHSLMGKANVLALFSGLYVYLKSQEVSKLKNKNYFETMIDDSIRIGRTIDEYTMKASKVVFQEDLIQGLGDELNPISFVSRTKDITSFNDSLELLVDEYLSDVRKQELFADVKKSKSQLAKDPDLKALSIEDRLGVERDIFAKMTDIQGQGDTEPLKRGMMYELGYLPEAEGYKMIDQVGAIAKSNQISPYDVYSDTYLNEYPVSYKTFDTLNGHVILTTTQTDGHKVSKHNTVPRIVGIDGDSIYMSYNQNVYVTTVKSQSSYWGLTFDKSQPEMVSELNEKMTRRILETGQDIDVTKWGLVQIRSAVYSKKDISRPTQTLKVSTKTGFTLSNQQLTTTFIDDLYLTPDELSVQRLKDQPVNFIASRLTGEDFLNYGQDKNTQSGIGTMLLGYDQKFRGSIYSSLNIDEGLTIKAFRESQAHYNSNVLMHGRIAMMIGDVPIFQDGSSYFVNNPFSQATTVSGDVVGQGIKLSGLNSLKTTVEGSMSREELMRKGIYVAEDTVVISTTPIEKMKRGASNYGFSLIYELKDKTDDEINKIFSDFEKVGYTKEGANAIKESFYSLREQVRIVDGKILYKNVEGFDQRNTLIRASALGQTVLDELNKGDKVDLTIYNDGIEKLVKDMFVVVQDGSDNRVGGINMITSFNISTTSSQMNKIGERNEVNPFLVNAKKGQEISISAKNAIETITPTFAKSLNQSTGYVFDTDTNSFRPSALRTELDMMMPNIWQDKRTLGFDQIDLKDMDVDIVMRENLSSMAYILDNDLLKSIDANNQMLAFKFHYETIQANLSEQGLVGTKRSKILRYVNSLDDTARGNYLVSLEGLFNNLSIEENNGVISLNSNFKQQFKIFKAMADINFNTANSTDVAIIGSMKTSLENMLNNLYDNTVRDFQGKTGLMGKGIKAFVIQSRSITSEGWIRSFVDNMNLSTVDNFKLDMIALQDAIKDDMLNTVGLMEIDEILMGETLARKTVEGTIIGSHDILDIEKSFNNAVRYPTQTGHATTVMKKRIVTNKEVFHIVSRYIKDDMKFESYEEFESLIRRADRRDKRYGMALQLRKMISEASDKMTGLGLGVNTMAQIDFDGDVFGLTDTLNAVQEIRDVHKALVSIKEYDPDDIRTVALERDLSDLIDQIDNKKLLTTQKTYTKIYDAVEHLRKKVKVSGIVKYLPDVETFVNTNLLFKRVVNTSYESLETRNRELGALYGHVFGTDKKSGIERSVLAEQFYYRLDEDTVASKTGDYSLLDEIEEIGKAREELFTRAVDDGVMVSVDAGGYKLNAEAFEDFSKEKRKIFKKYRKEMNDIIGQQNRIIHESQVGYSELLDIQQRKVNARGRKGTRDYNAMKTSLDHGFDLWNTIINDSIDNEGEYIRDTRGRIFSVETLDGTEVMTPISYTQKNKYGEINYTLMKERNAISANSISVEEVSRLVKVPVEMMDEHKQYIIVDKINESKARDAEFGSAKITKMKNVPVLLNQFKKLMDERSYAVSQLDILSDNYYDDRLKLDLTFKNRQLTVINDMIAQASDTNSSFAKLSAKQKASYNVMKDSLPRYFLAVTKLSSYMTVMEKFIPSEKKMSGISNDLFVEWFDHVTQEALNTKSIGDGFPMDISHDLEKINSIVFSNIDNETPQYRNAIGRLVTGEYEYKGEAIDKFLLSIGDKMPMGIESSDGDGMVSSKSIITHAEKMLKEIDLGGTQETIKQVSELKELVSVIKSKQNLGLESYAKSKYLNRLGVRGEEIIPYAEKLVKEITEGIDVTREVSQTKLGDGSTLARHFMNFFAATTSTTSHLTAKDLSITSKIQGALYKQITDSASTPTNLADASQFYKNMYSDELKIAKAIGGDLDLSRGIGKPMIKNSKLQFILLGLAGSMALIKKNSSPMFMQYDRMSNADIAQRFTRDEGVDYKARRRVEIYRESKRRPILL